MPIRIKPVHDFGTCVLTLEGIQGIVDLVEKDFPSATYSAADETWEIFDETKSTFLAAISKSLSLNSVAPASLCGAAGMGMPAQRFRDRF